MHIKLISLLGEIGQVLKARVTDSNKAVQTLALDIVSRIATGMGKPFEKYTRLYALPIATVLSDQKAPIRAAGVQALTAIATACDVDSMVAGFTTALETQNPLQKSSLLNWLADWFKEHEVNSGVDLNSWVGPVIASLDDRNVDVRKGAQALLPTLVAAAGYDYVMSQTHSLKPASRSTVAPLIQAARPAAPPPPAPAVKPGSGSRAVANAKAAPPEPASAPSPPPPETMSAENSKLAAPGKLGGVRRKLPQGTVARPESRSETPDSMLSSRLTSKIGTGLKRPGSTLNGPTRASAQPAMSTYTLPLVGDHTEAKRQRLGKDAQRWINEAGPTRKDLAELLQHQMENHASKDLLSLLFSRDHNAVNDHVSGLTILYDFYSSVQAGEAKPGFPLESLQSICLANSDLALKYVSIKAHEPQSNLVQKCLDVVDAVIGFFQSVDYQIGDPEALCFVPTIVYKVRPSPLPLDVGG